MVDKCQVLTIQSHVVHGYVGNRCAVFPLQLHGFEVDSINSVQFSNHTGYPAWKGQALNYDQLKDLYEGLTLNKVNNYTHLLTGYCRNDTFLSEVAEIVSDLKAKNQDFFYICDPVMGDEGHYYVSEALMPLYRDRIGPLADIITPNQFELEVLSGIDIDSEETLLKGICALHDKNIPNVVVTSTSIGQGEEMFVYSSERQNGQSTVYRFTIERFRHQFFGTGDLFTSLLLVWMVKTDHNLKVSVEKVLSTIQAVLKRTLSSAKDTTSDQLELKLVQSREELLNPQLPIRITKIH